MKLSHSIVRISLGKETMRPIDKATARHHTDLSEERYHVDGRSKRLIKRFAKRKSSKAYRRAAAKRAQVDAAESSLIPGIPPCP